MPLIVLTMLRYTKKRQRFFSRDCGDVFIGLSLLCDALMCTRFLFYIFYSQCFSRVYVCREYGFKTKSGAGINYSEAEVWKKVKSRCESAGVYEVHN